MQSVPFLLLYNISHMRICTWNSRGDKFNNNNVKSLLQNNKIDILCLQECGNLARYFNKNHDINSYQKVAWYNYILIYHVWNVGGRCDMAVLVEQNIEIDNIYINKAQILYDNNGNEISGMPACSDKSLVRAMMTLELQYNGMPYTINNVHLPSGNKPFARKVGYRLFCNSLMKNTKNMFTLGDFNTPPDTWTLPNGFQITHTNVGTHTSGNILDYMIYNNQNQYMANRVEDTYTSDHYPVYFDI